MTEKIKKKLLEQLEKEAERLHNSTRTDLPFLSPVHNFLRTRSKIYYSWSAYPRAQKVHRYGLLGFLVSFLFFTFLQFVFPNLFIPEIKPVLAGSHTITWDTKGDFENNAGTTNDGDTTRSNLDTASSSGDIRLGETLDKGTGNDGDLPIFGSSLDGGINSTFNINVSTFQTGRTVADGIATSLSGNVGVGATALSVTSVSGFAVNDEILIARIQDTAPKWETKIISAVDSGNNTLTIPALSDSYTSGALIQRIPNYASVKIASGGKITASAWNGTIGGVVAFRVSGTLSIASGGSIDVSGLSNIKQSGVDATGDASNSGGGAGYGTAGSDGSGSTKGVGGSTYGDSNNPFLIGRKGGRGGTANTSYGEGGNGGGIIFVESSNIVNSGSIISNGLAGANKGTYTGAPCLTTDSWGNCTQWTTYYSGAGGGGSGGSIFLKGSVSGSGTITANAGTGGTADTGSGGNGGIGRTKIETGSNFGTSNDGHFPFVLQSSFNINTQTNGLNSRPYADGIATTLSSAVSTGAITITVANSNGFSIGDEIFIARFWKTGDAIGDAWSGVYKSENKIISGKSGNILTIPALTNAYPSSALVQRVPNYNNIKIGSGKITANAWNGSTGGVVIFRALGTLSIGSGGSIDVVGLGYGVNSGPGKGAAAPPCPGGTVCFKGSGAGYGGNGASGSSSSYGDWAGGTAYTSFPDLGSGGGDCCYACAGSGGGGKGGGSIRIVAGNIRINSGGSINATGGASVDPDAAGGSGGSAYLTSPNIINSGTISVSPGSGGLGSAGGRLKIESSSSVGGTITYGNFAYPGTTIINPYYPSGTLGGIGSSKGLRINSQSDIVNWKSITAVIDGDIGTAGQQSLQTGQAVKFLIRLSSDGINWTIYNRDGVAISDADIEGVNGFGGKYFGKSAADAEFYSIPAIQLPSLRWAELIVRLENGASSTPAVNSVSLTFNTMDAPQDNNISGENYISQHRVDNGLEIAKGTGYTNQNQVKIKGTNLSGMNDGSTLDFQVELRPTEAVFDDTECNNPASTICKKQSGIAEDGSGELTFDLNYPTSTTYKWRARLIDSAARFSTWKEFNGVDNTDFSVEQTAPTAGSFVITKTADADGTDSQFTKDLTVKLTNISSSDTGGSGLAWMQFSNNGSNWGTQNDGTSITDTSGNCTSSKQWDGTTCWAPYATAFSNWNLSSLAGATKTAYAQFKDGAGNVSGIWTQTTDADFNAGTKIDVVASANGLQLAPFSDAFASSYFTTPTLSGGVQVAKTDNTNIAWGPQPGSCVGPQCATGIDPNYPSNYSLVSNNNIDFTAYPARNACKTIGGRLPTSTELQEMYNNKASYGASSYFYYSATEVDTATAYLSDWMEGNYLGHGPKNNSNNEYSVRCVRGVAVFASSGNLVSAVKDNGTNQIGYGKINWTETPATGATLNVQVRAGNVATPDGTWTAWSANLTNNSSLSAYNGKRYIQYKALLTSNADQTLTPRLEDISIQAFTSDPITYDNTPPLDIANIQGFQQSPNVNPFNTNTWRNYNILNTSPYFTWDQGSDPESDVSGYYVYWGTNSSANPSSAGTNDSNNYWEYISGKANANFSNKSITLASGQTYYLNIKALNGAGDTSTNLTQFVYKYDNTPPVLSNLTLSDTLPTKAGTVTFTIDFTDTSNMDTAVSPTVTFGTNSPDFNQCTVNQSSYTGNTWTGTVIIPTCGSTDGTNTIKVTGAKDNAGNQIADNTSNTFTLDTVNPSETSNPFVLKSTSSFVTNRIKQSDTYYIYANATDASPSSGIKTVTSNASSLTTGQTAASLTTAGGPWTVNSVSYAYRSSQLTADVGLTNGSKNITLTTTDNADNVFTSNPYSITADSTAPQVQGSAIISDLTPTKAGTVTFTVNFSEDMNTSINPTVTFGISDPYNQRSVNQSMAWNTSTQWQGDIVIPNDGIFDGLNTIKVTGAKDTAGNDQTEDTGTTFTIDTVNPVVSNITSITSNGAYNAGNTIVIEVTFTDVHNLTVTGTPRLKMNIGVPDRYANFVSLSGKTLTFNYIVQDGDNSLDLDYTDINSLELNLGTIKDEADNDATLTLPAPTASGSLSFNKDIIIDTTPPAKPSLPDLDAADDNGEYNDDNITSNTTNLTLSGTAEANSIIEVFDGVTSKGTTTAVGGVWTLDISLPEGVRSITVKATDAAGNTSIASDALTVTIDTTNPSNFNLLTPSDWSWINTLRPTLDWEDTVEANFLKYEVYIDSVLKTSITNISTSQWLIDYDLTEGIHTWTVKVLDLAGHETSTLSGAFNVQIDVTKPTSSISSPSTGLYTNASTLDFLGTALRNDNLSDITNVYISTDGGLTYPNNATDTAVNPDPLFSTWNWTWTTGSDGAYTIQTKAKDQALNEEENPGTDAIIVTIDKTPVTGGSVNDGLTTDINWTNSTTSLSANWSGFTDANGISKYKYAIQRANDNYYWDGSGGFNSSEYWVDNLTNTSFTVSSNLVLASGQIYRIRVKAYDPTMSESNATIVNSNGISVDTSLPSSTVSMSDYYGPNTWNATSVSGTALDNGIAPAGPSGISKTEISIRRNSDTQYWTGSNWSNDNIQRWLNVGNSASWSYNLPFANLTNNISYTITSKSEDVAGNIQSALSTDTFTYDNTTTNPTLNIGANLVLNSSFEKDEDSNGNPDNWGGVSYTNNGYAGTRSLRITTPGSFARQNIQVKSGVTYTQSVYVKGSGSLRIGNTSGAGVNNAITVASIPSEWTRYSSTFTALSEGNAELTLILDSGAEVQFDAVQLEEGSLTYFKDDNYIKDTNWTSSAISGTSKDLISGIQKTEIRIKRSGDNYFWNPTLNSGNGNWQSGDYWINVGNSSTYTYGETAGQIQKVNASFSDNTTYTVEAKTTDNVNNTSSSVLDSVLWDFTKPNTTVTNLTGQILNSSSYIQSDTIKGGASDNGGSGISRTEVTIKNTNPSGNPDYNKYWTGSTWNTTETWLNVGNQTNWTYQGLSSANLRDGSTFTIIAKTYDQAANEPLSEASGTFVYDNSAPLAGTNPFLAAGTSDTQVTLTWDQWTDTPAGVKNFKIYRSINPSSFPSDTADPLNEGIYNGTSIADINVSDINLSTKEAGDTISFNAGVYTYEDNNLSMGWYYYKMVAYDSIDNASSFVRSHSKTNFLPKIGTTEGNIDLLTNTSNNNILSNKSTIDLTGNSTDRTVAFNWVIKDQDHNNPVTDIIEAGFTIKKPDNSVLATFSFDPRSQSSLSGSSSNGSWTLNSSLTSDSRGYILTSTFQFASSLPYGTYQAYSTVKDIIPSHIVDSNTSNISLPPKAIENLQAIGTDQNSSVKITWNPPLGRSSVSSVSGIQKYVIQRKIDEAGSNYATVKEINSGEVPYYLSGTNSYEYYDNGLSVLTYYLYRIQVVDASNNPSSWQETSQSVTVPDTSSPDPITNLTVSSLGSSGSTVTLTWTVPSDNSDTAIEPSIQTTKGVQQFKVYRRTQDSNFTSTDLIKTITKGTDPEFSSLSSAGDIITFVDSDLSESTTYHYLITALDKGLPEGDPYPENETTLVPTEGANYKKTTTLAVVTGLKIKSVSDSLAPGRARIFISWDTLNSTYQTASSPYNFANFVIERKVDQGSWSELSLINSISTNYLVNDHLDPDKNYQYRVKVKNANNDISNPSQEVSMQPDSIDVEKPLINFTNQPISEDLGVEPGVSSAVIKWKTNEPADSIVEYRKDGDGEYSKSAGDPRVIDKVNHSIIVPSLTQNTKYYFKLKSKDLAGNEQVSQEYFFTTQSLDISVPTVKTTSTSATISWITNISSSSQIEYQKQGVNTSSKIEGIPDLVKDHTVVLKGLNVGRYTYKIKSIDNDNNIAESSLLTFEIPSTDKGSLSTPQTGKVEEKEITATSAKVTWQSSTATTSWVDYGTTSGNYTMSAGDNTLATGHIVTLQNLVPDTAYYYKVRGVDASGIEYVSEEYILKALAEPSVSDIKVSNVTPYTATIIWKTNIKTDSGVNYGTSLPYSKREQSQEFTTSHELTLNNLQDQTTYSFQIEVKDEYGHTVKSENKNFTTPLDTTGPKIFEVKLSPLQGGDSEKRGVIITWMTDKESTSQIEYGAGVTPGKYESKTPIDQTLNLSHTVIISDLEPGATYHFRLISKDKRGNETKSQDYTMLTQEKEESIFQLILQTLEETFSWVGKVKDFVGNQFGKLFRD